MQREKRFFLAGQSKFFKTKTFQKTNTWYTNNKKRCEISSTLTRKTQ